MRCGQETGDVNRRRDDMGRQIGGKKMVAMSVWMSVEDHDRLTRISREMKVSRAQLVRSELRAAMERLEKTDASSVPTEDD